MGLEHRMNRKVIETRLEKRSPDHRGPRVPGGRSPNRELSGSGEEPEGEAVRVWELLLETRTEQKLEGHCHTPAERHLPGGPPDFSVRSSPPHQCRDTLSPGLAHGTDDKGGLGAAHSPTGENQPAAHPAVCSHGVRGSIVGWALYQRRADTPSPRGDPRPGQEGVLRACSQEQAAPAGVESSPHRPRVRLGCVRSMRLPGTRS
ncbi:uncharacterized protein LOC116876990 [Lontra canadensis]|uniref:uncharacterized protein LOC116876990 n=1 Tax=Lontra canadensis TaxID=76717 RepID=UPI0013F38F13|nr:uncharacterized protein LOC116876990 [Lontra canadensis]